MEVTPDSYFVDQYWWSADGETLYFTERAGLGRSPWLEEISGNDLRPRLVYKTDRPEFLSHFASDGQGTTIRLPLGKQRFSPADRCH